MNKSSEKEFKIQSTYLQCRNRGDKTSFHIIAKCPVLARARLNHFGSYELFEPLTWHANQVSSFLRDAKMDTLLVASPNFGARGEQTD